MVPSADNNRHIAEQIDATSPSQESIPLPDEMPQISLHSLLEAFRGIIGATPTANPHHDEVVDRANEYAKDLGMDIRDYINLGRMTTHLFCKTDAEMLSILMDLMMLLFHIDDNEGSEVREEKSSVDGEPDVHLPVHVEIMKVLRPKPGEAAFIPTHPYTLKLLEIIKRFDIALGHTKYWDEWRGILMLVGATYLDKNTSFKSRGWFADNPYRYFVYKIHNSGMLFTLLLLMLANREFINPAYVKDEDDSFLGLLLLDIMNKHDPSSIVITKFGITPLDAEQQLPPAERLTAVKDYLQNEFRVSENFSRLVLLLHTVSLIGTLTNDVFSYPKEVIDEKGYVNLVRVLGEYFAQQGVCELDKPESVSLPYNRMIRLISELLHTYKYLQDEILKLEFRPDGALGKFIDGIHDVVRATIHWQLETLRYRHKEHPFYDLQDLEKLILLVELLEA